MTLETSSVDFVVFVIISTVPTVLVPIVAQIRVESKKNLKIF